MTHGIFLEKSGSSKRELTTTVDLIERIIKDITHLMKNCYVVFTHE